MAVHRDLTPIGQHVLRKLIEFLDKAENVIPTPTVLANDMIFEFVQNLVNFKGRQNGLDQYGDLDLACANHAACFGKAEHIAPESRFEMGLHFR